MGDQDAFSEDDAYQSPEEAAIASFPSTARPKVQSTTAKGDDLAVVHLVLDPDYDCYVYVQQRAEGWIEVHGTI